LPYSFLLSRSLFACIFDKYNHVLHPLQSGGVETTPSEHRRLRIAISMVLSAVFSRPNGPKRLRSNDERPELSVQRYCIAAFSISPLNEADFVNMENRIVKIILLFGGYSEIREEY